MKSRILNGVALLCALSALSMGQNSPPKLVQMQKELPKAMLSAISIGAKPASDKLSLSISLNLSDPAGLQSYADSVSDPYSPNYRRFISPEEVGRRFGPSMAQVQAVTTFLKSSGMKIRLVGKNRMSILAETTVAKAQAAFHTSIEQFRPATAPMTPATIRFSFTTPPSIPAGIADYVQNIAGLEDFSRPQRRVYLTPTQLRTAYGLSTIYSGGSQGQGRTVGISNYDGFKVSNVATEITQFTLPSPSAGATTNIKVETVSGGSGSGQESGEGDLDIQTVIGMAPLSNVIIYDGGSNDIIGVLTLEASDNTADIITESYGWTLDASTAIAAHNLHVAMSSQGITYMAASGDSGTDLQGYDYPNKDPEVLSVGGTSLVLNSNNTRQTEVGWNSNGGAGGGGWAVTTDAFNKRPSYQVGTGIPPASSIPYRLFPDVSMDADPGTGYYVYMEGNWYGIGGTSGACPTFAGGLADCEQQLIKAGAIAVDSTGHYRLGRIQDLLYSYNGDASVFYDVKSGTNGVLPNGSNSVATVGWDTDSGWGPISWAGFVSKFSYTAGFKSLTLGATAIEGGGSTTGTVTLSSAAPTGGQVVSLTSSDSSTTVPATITVAAGSTTGTFKVSTASVSATTAVTITASIGSATATATLTVNTHYVSAVAISPSSAVGGTPSAITGTVTIDKSAPANGLAVTLQSSNSGLASVPTSVTVPSGSTSATFTVTTAGVSSTTAVQISATAGGQSKSGTLTLSPAALSTVTLNATSVDGGANVTGTVTLNGLAAGSGASVSLKSSIASAASITPSTLVIGAGHSSGTFTVKTQAVSAAKTVTITAKLGSVSKTATLKIVPLTATTLSISKSSALGGVDNPTVTVTLNGVAGSAGASVTLSTTPSSAAKFASTTLKIAAGEQSASTTLKTLGVSANTVVTVKATLNGSQSAKITVTPAILTSLTLNPTSIKGGTGNVTGTVTLNGPAGPGARSVSLKNSSTAAGTMPGSVSIGAGKTSATFTFKSKVVKATTSATITATLSGQSQTATLTVTH
ncbi:MAG: protease pro-enzyme activation domain-containing protein [Fimbriimonas sp.]|nr:protease pro-enzyme activation domain-containing protein [Fimbriimonas sp.]